MSDNEKLEHVRYDEDKSHCWINGDQWTSFIRMCQIRADYDREISVLAKEVKRLTAENEAYKVLLKDKINKED